MNLRYTNDKDIQYQLKIVCSVIYLLLFSFCICLLSRQNYFTDAMPGTDSSVFMTIAKGMIYGNIPYLDYFDHKGPFLYLLNYIGYSLGGIHGVWVIEIITITVAIFFTYATVKKLFGNIVALCSTTVGYFLLYRYLEGGNLTEEFALPLISIAVYVATSILLSQNSSMWQSYVLGFTFGLSLMLRPNMFSVWFVFSAYWVISSFIKKRYKVVVGYILFFAIGTVVSILPFIIYMLCNNALYDYIYQNFIFNSQYAKYKGIRSIIENVFAVTYSSTYAIVLSLLSCVAGFFNQKKNKQIVCMILFFSTILSISFVSISQAIYGHYYMVFIPVITVSYGVLFELFEKMAFQYGFEKKCVITVLLGLTLCLSLNDLCKTGFTLVNNEKETPDGEISAVVEKINKSAKDDDTLQVLGNMCSIYLQTDVKPANKFIYDLPIANISPDVHEQFAQAWTKNSPSYVVVSKQYSESDSDHIKWVIHELKSNYVIAFKTDNYRVYQKLN